MLQLEKRSLESALAHSQREAFALTSQLERASALTKQLEQAQSDAKAQALVASSAKARIALLEKAWTAALEVGGTLLATLAWGAVVRRLAACVGLGVAWRTRVEPCCFVCACLRLKRPRPLFPPLLLQDARQLKAAGVATRW